MTDYTELVKALRCCDKYALCNDCPIFETCDGDVDKAMAIAATAIEALQAELEKKRTADCWGCKCEKMEASSRLQKRGEPVLLAALPTASPWHRVEEPPKEEGRYWCAVRFDGHWIFDAAWYTHDISTVFDVPCCEQVGGFYKGNTEVHPDCWMPIEPPKEEN